MAHIIYAGQLVNLCLLCKLINTNTNPDTDTNTYMYTHKLKCTHKLTHMQAHTLQTQLYCQSYWNNRSKFKQNMLN